MATLLKHLLASPPRREWLTMLELAKHGRFTSSEAARQYVSRLAKRHPELSWIGKRGRRWIAEREGFDRYVLEQGRRTA